MGDSEVSSCIKQLVARWRFPAPAAGLLKSSSICVHRISVGEAWVDSAPEPYIFPRLAACVSRVIRRRTKSICEVSNVEAGKIYLVVVANRTSRFGAIGSPWRAGAGNCASCGGGYSWAAALDVSGPDMVSKQRVPDQHGQGAAELQTMVEQSRKQKDVIRLNCVMDKLAQVKVSMNIATRQFRSCKRASPATMTGLRSTNTPHHIVNQKFRSCRTRSDLRGRGAQLHRGDPGGSRCS